MLRRVLDGGREELLLLDSQREACVGFGPELGDVLLRAPVHFAEVKAQEFCAVIVARLKDGGGRPGRKLKGGEVGYDLMCSAEDRRYSSGGPLEPFM